MLKNISKVEDILIIDFIEFFFENIELKEIKNASLDSNLKKILDYKSNFLENLYIFLQSNVNQITINPRPDNFVKSSRVREQLFITNKNISYNSSFKEHCSLNMFIEYSAQKKLTNIKVQTQKKIINDSKDNSKQYYDNISIEFGSKYIKAIKIEKGIFEFKYEKYIDLVNKKNFIKNHGYFFDHDTLQDNIQDKIKNNSIIVQEDFDLLSINDDRYLHNYYKQLPNLFGEKLLLQEKEIIEFCKKINISLKQLYNQKKVTL